MTQAAHTPGPWKVEPGFHRNRIADADDAAICFALGFTQEATANARLIAAAPELLITLSNLIAAIEEYGAYKRGEFMINDVLELARAAVAKAEGAI
jgi:hypothetical protein